MKSKNILIIATIFGTLAVILGAFGAHALKEVLTEEQLISYKTGVSYQFYHTFLLLIIGISARFENTRLLRISAWCCTIGILFFSGSIYLLACKDIIGINNTAIIGPITPLGGLLFICSWILLCINFIKSKFDE